MARFFVSFFFQVEDGIRALTVTGVQTCALPISAIGSICSHGARRIFLQIAWQEDAMLGVRFGAVCTIVLGGMLVSSAAHAAQACDQRFPRTCKPAAAQNSREAPKATSAPRAATAIRSRRVARHRQGVRHAQSARPARRTTESSVRPPIVPHVQETSPAARRFSEFVSPRLLAANPVEEFRKPRMNVSELSGQTAYPVVDRMEREPSAAAIDPARAAARDTFDELEP